MSQFICSLNIRDQKTKLVQTEGKNYYIKHIGQGKYEVRYYSLKVPSFKVTKKSVMKNKVKKFDGFMDVSKYIISKVIKKTLNYKPESNTRIETVLDIHSLVKDNGFLDRYRDILFNMLAEEVSNYNSTPVYLRFRKKYTITKIYNSNPDGSLKMIY
jgi:hypothetical protein